MTTEQFLKRALRRVRTRAGREITAMRAAISALELEFLMPEASPEPRLLPGLTLKLLPPDAEARAIFQLWLNSEKNS
jgi:hypothetical protein